MCTDFFTAKYNEIFFSENSFNFEFTLYKMHFKLICQTQGDKNLKYSLTGLFVKTKVIQIYKN